MTTVVTTRGEQLAELALWKMTVLCLGIVALVVPLMILPGVIAAGIRSVYPAAYPYPIPHPIDTSLVAIVLALCVVPAIRITTGIESRDVFVDRPTIGSVRWIAVGLTLVAAVGVGILLASDGVVGWGPLGSGPTATSTRVAYLIASAVLLALWAGVMEEILFRGYLLGIVGYRWNWPTAIAITSGLFGLLHLGAASDPIAQATYVAVAGIAGLLFGVVTYYTGSVWNAVAIHATWNAAFGSHVVAFPSPGADPGESLVLVQGAFDSPLLGGGVGTPIESPLAALVLLAAVAGIVMYFRNTGGGPRE